MILSNEKAFRGILGNPTANWWGLHIARILLSDLMLFLRRAPLSWLAFKHYRAFAKNGIVIIENFADANALPAIYQEVQTALKTQAITPDLGTVGFGQKHLHAHGFDRYDGSSLNRLVEIDQYPQLKALFSSNKMHKLTLALFGMLNRKQYYVYELKHGDHTKNHDKQKDTHKDTFHSTYKLWYFVEDVTLEAGPFEYAYQSNRSTWKRLKWEYQMSCAASREPGHPNRGGAFRISQQDLAQIAQPLTKVLVKANSLVIADTRGFHRRGDAPKGSSRISVYANFRPIAFLPFLH